MFRSFSKSAIEGGKGKLSSSISKVMLEGIDKSLSWCYVMLEGCKREYLLRVPGLMYLPTPEWKAFKGWLGTARGLGVASATASAAFLFSSSDLSSASCQQIIYQHKLGMNPFQTSMLILIYLQAISQYNFDTNVICNVK